MADATPSTSETPDTGRKRVLLVLKTKGAMTAPRLARRLGVTPMAVYQQLRSLHEDGLVDFTKERHNVGRPAYLWRLTSKAHERFPDRHAQFAVGMLEAIRSAFGEEGIERLNGERARRQIALYRDHMPKLPSPLDERVRILAEVRRTEGFMTEWGRDCVGSVEFVEHHCSIAKIAGLCPDVCESELEVFRAVLGDDVDVRRIEHALKGDPRCSYRIVESASEANACSADGSPAPAASIQPSGRR